MINYQRCIGKIVINILVDETIYKNEKKVFDSLFRTFDNTNLPFFSNHIYYYIYGKSINRIASGNEYTVCDTNDKEWVFSLINDLEGLYAAVLKCTVIHGSCVAVNGKRILLIGERQAGKTTLTHYFVYDKNGEYLDDDCVYIIDDSYVGFCTPLPMRNQLDSNHTNHIVCETLDTDGVMRTLYHAPKAANSFPKIDVVVFPKYTPTSENSIKKLDSANAFQRIIQNVRSYGKMKKLFNDINKLSSNTRCYELNYSSSEAAYEMLYRSICK